MTTDAALAMQPTPDPAEDQAFFPSPYSLTQFTAPKTDLSDTDYVDAYAGGRWKVLMLAADERYLEMANGTMFSTGNHPVETLLPMTHIDSAGFAIDVATLSGNPVKFELWAMPREDEAVLATFAKYREKFRNPLRLADVVADALGPDSDYLGVLIPGGHGALIGLPFSRDVKAVLDWALAADRHIISLCHGPAALLAAGLGEADNASAFAGYRMCAFPDEMDRQVPEIGYTPGALTWHFGERLRAQGVVIVNEGITGQTEIDRKLITGDSPLASNALGKIAARALIDAARSMA